VILIAVLFRFLNLIFTLVVVAAATAPSLAAETSMSPAAKLLAQPRFQMPVGWQWGHFENADHASIRYGFAKATNPRATVVFVTGYTGDAEEFFESIRDLLVHGYDVWEMDWRGNGGSQRYLPNHDKVHLLGTSHDANDLYQFTTKIVRKEEGKPLYLISHSYGGLVSLEFMHEHPQVFDKVVLSSPGVTFPKVPYWWANKLAGGMCALGFGKDYALDQDDYPHLEPKLLNPLWHTHDEERLLLPDAIFQTHPDLRIGGVTWGFIYEFTGACIKLTTPKYLKEIKTPVLVCSGKADWISDPNGHARVAKLLGNAQFFSIPDGRHELMRESDNLRNAWFNRVYMFLDGIKPAQEARTASK